MSALARIRALVDAAPPDGTVTVAWLAELLESESGGSDALHEDFTVDDVASSFGRAASTIRAWCQAGRIPGAYRLRGREWRIPLSGLEAFRAAEQSALTVHVVGAASSTRSVDLGRWRRLKQSTRQAMNVPESPIAHGRRPDEAG